MNPGSMRALVVEDDRSWQMILSELLGDAGLVVDVADSLASARTILRVYPHRLAVVDLSLAGDDAHNRDGLAVVDALRQHDPGCVTMLLTGFATVELAVSVLTEYNAFTCLRKEAFQRAQFRDLIHRAMASAHPPAAPRMNATANAREYDTEAAREANLAKSQPRKTALVVEDDAGWRSILYELLVDAGYQVRMCSGYGEALSCLRRDKFSLAVIDLSLAGAVKTNVSTWEQSPSTRDLEGYRLLTSTRANGIPTIVVSGVANPADIERVYQEQGIFAYIEKQSFDRKSFLTVLQESQAIQRSTSELEALTEREREVLDLLSQGMTNKEIADILFISTNTVKRHLKAIFSKLDIHTRSAAAAKALNSSSE
jgi:DNA-binding NarL/FixJ family response regulator